MDIHFRHEGTAGLGRSSYRNRRYPWMYLWGVSNLCILNEFAGVDRGQVSDKSTGNGVKDISESYGRLVLDRAGNHFRESAILVSYTTVLWYDLVKLSGWEENPCFTGPVIERIDNLFTDKLFTGAKTFTLFLGDLRLLPFFLFLQGGDLAIDVFDTLWHGTFLSFGYYRSLSSF